MEPTSSKIPFTDRDKINLEKYIRKILDKNGFGTKIWSMILGTFVMGFFTSLILAWPVELIWNRTLPLLVYAIQPITFWKAFGILYLLRLLRPTYYRR